MHGKRQNITSNAVYNLQLLLLCINDVLLMADDEMLHNNVNVRGK